MKPLEILPEALAEEAASWYAERAPRVAARFAEELDAALSRIAEAPRRWPVYLHGTRRARLNRFPYLVPYRDEPDRMLIVAVAHAKRKPGNWRKR